jgi:hypothetical protein
VLPIFAGQLESIKTGFPFRYYSLDFCNNTSEVNTDEGERQIVKNSMIDYKGNPLVNSPFSYKFGTHKQGMIPCTKTFSKQQVD